MFFLPSSAEGPGAPPRPTFPGSTPPSAPTANRAPMRSPAPPPWPRPAAFVLPHSLSQPVRSRQTEWQPLIGGSSAANQKGAPHVRARSFKRASRGARGGGRGGGPARRAAPRCIDAQRGARGPCLQSAWDWPGGGFPAPNRAPARTSWGGFSLSLRFRSRGEGPRSGSAQGPKAWGGRAAHCHDEAPESLPAGAAPGAGAAAGGGERRGAGRR